MAEATICPYCRMPFDEQGPPKIFCTACGTPHHEDCYQENGGCTVFGCSHAPADDPKLQVSYSDLNAAVIQQQPGQQQNYAAPQTPVATTPVFPSPYGGPLGLNQPAPVTGAAVVVPAPTGAAYPQSAMAEGRSAKNRTTYIVLGVFLGAFGVHNFYAGYTGRAIGQLCLSVFTLLYLAIVSWIWAIVEICIVDRDSAGIQFS